MARAGRLGGHREGICSFGRDERGHPRIASRHCAIGRFPRRSSRPWQSPSGCSVFGLLRGYVASCVAGKSTLDLSGLASFPLFFVRFFEGKHSRNSRNIPKAERCGAFALCCFAQGRPPRPALAAGELHPYTEDSSALLGPGARGCEAGESSRVSNPVCIEKVFERSTQKMKVCIFLLLKCDDHLPT